MSTIKRGRILRDTNAGDGLVSVDGVQYPFRLEGMWKSDHAPKVDNPVHVEFDDAGGIVALRAVDPAEAAREQAAKLAGKAGETARQVAAGLQEKGVPILKDYAALIGVPTLVALGALLLGWFFLDTVSVDAFGQKVGATFYQLMAALRNPANATDILEGGGSKGLYGLLCLIAFVLPLLPHFWPQRKAWLAYCAPLAWMVLAALIGYVKARSSLSGASDAMEQLGGSEYAEMAKKMAAEAMKAALEYISIGLGFYLALAASIYLAFIGVKRFLGRPRS